MKIILRSEEIICKMGIFKHKAKLIHWIFESDRKTPRSGASEIRVTAVCGKHTATKVFTAKSFGKKTIRLSDIQLTPRWRRCLLSEAQTGRILAENKDRKFTGTVRWFCKSSGEGFISCHELGESYIEVYACNLPGAKSYYAHDAGVSLPQGAEVTFNLSGDQYKYFITQATPVEKLDSHTNS